MNNRRVTLKDIAEKTGFSINTVSLALKGQRVSEETRELIVKTAKELGYIGNALASSMRSGLTGTIAIIVGDIANPYFAAIIKGTVNLLSAKQYSTIIYNTEEREDYEKSSILSALRQNVDGVLISPVVKDGANIKLLKDSNIPLVIFGGTSHDPSISTVCLDDVKGGYIATKYLLERGHRDIVFLNGPDFAQSSRERLNGYKQALLEEGIPYDEKKVLHCDLKNDKMVWEQVKYQLSHVLDYTGVITYSDMTAMRLYSLLDSEDFKDKQIGAKDIVGFDNVMETFPLPIKTASVGPKDIKMSVVAPSLLLDLIYGETQDVKRIVLDVKVYVP